MKKYEKAFVVGKFMPPHVGHEYLINFASLWATDLYVLVDNVPGQTMEPRVRCEILHKHFASNPNIHISYHPVSTPQSPEEHGDRADFFNIWKSIIHSHVVPDVIIGSMDYVKPVSEVLGCDYIKIDVEREAIPMSATSLKANFNDNWDSLISSAKPHYLKKLCFIGPESTGKTIAAQLISQKFKTVFVPEYAKSFIEEHNSFTLEDAEFVCSVQDKSQAALVHTARKILICDSDALTTKVWCETLFGNTPQLVKELSSSQHFDLTFLFAPNTPWINDVHRNVALQAKTQEFRQKMFDDFERELIELKRPYVVVNGDSYEERISFIESVIADKFNFSPELNTGKISSALRL